MALSSPCFEKVECTFRVVLCVLAMRGHIQNLFIHTLFFSKKYEKLKITKGEKNRFSQNTDSPKTDFNGIQRRELFIS